MQKIFKYTLSFEDEQVIDLPSGSKPIHVAYQGGNLRLWAEIFENHSRTETYIIKIIGTGHATNLSQFNYIGTVHQSNPTDLNLLLGVWHVYYWRE